MHKIKDEDLLDDCMQIQDAICVLQLSGRCLKLYTSDTFTTQI